MPLFLPQSVIQTQFTEISSDTTTTSTTFTDLMSLNISTTGASYLLVDFSASHSVTSANSGATYQLQVDGTPIRGCASGAGTGAQNSPGFCAGFVYKSGILSSGSHTVLIRWRVNAGTGQIRPATQDDEHASLLVAEITV